MADAPAKEFSDETKALAEKLVGLTLKQAQELVDCLKEEHGIEPAGGAPVMMAGGPGAGAEAGAAEEEKTAFDVVLKSAGDQKIKVIKVVRAATSLGLKEAKELVEAVPKPVKEGLPKEEADKLKSELEDAGGVVELA